MVLVDVRRLHVDVNGAYLKLLGYRRDDLLGRPLYEFVAGGPLVSADEWGEALAGGPFNGEAELIASDGQTVAVQWAASPETVTGRQLVLFVALSTSRWGHRFRRKDFPEASALSDREREVVRFVAHGHSSPEIADELQIAHHTVRTHVRNAMTKLGARSRAHLVAKAFGDGVVLR